MIKEVVENYAEYVAAKELVETFLGLRKEGIPDRADASLLATLVRMVNDGHEKQALMVLEMMDVSHKDPTAEPETEPETETKAGDSEQVEELLEEWFKNLLGVCSTPIKPM